MLRPPKPVPGSSTRSRPARCGHRAPISLFHSSGSSAPIVTQADIGTGFGLASSGFRSFTPTAKARFSVTSDLSDTTPWTRPCTSTTGPPLLPGSTAMASWTIFRPSTSRVADTTPLTTLNRSPFGLPNATTACPSLSASESPSGQRLQALRVDLDDRQVELDVVGVDGGHVVLRAVGELDGDRPALADDVGVGGDEPVGRDDEPGAEPLLAGVPPASGNRAQRRLDLLGQFLGRLVGGGGGEGEQQEGQDAAGHAGLRAGLFIVQARRRCRNPVCR